MLTNMLAGTLARQGEAKVLTKKGGGVLLPLVACLGLVVSLVGLVGCRPSSVQTAATSVGKHVAHHDGCLNAVVTCENGHAEVKVSGDTLQCWFVGGGNNTGASVPIGDHAITLSVKPAGSQTTSTLVLHAKPLPLAEETVGHCSYFVGQAAWLKGISTFTATGTLQHYQGQSLPLRIEYPRGYDPD
jgi:hypothetical protein